MDIEKIIIHKDDSITIHFNRIRAEPDGEDPIWEKYKFKSNRPAHAEFYKSLADLKPHAIEMLEINDGEIARVSVKGATFKRTKEGIMGVVMSIERTMNHTETPLKLETPHYIAESYSEDGDEQNILADDCVIVLKKLKAESVKYVEGFSDQIEADL